MAAFACTFNLSYKVVVCSLLGATAILSPILNFFVCLTIFRNRGLRTAGNILIANLAISDILIGPTLAPLEVVYIAYFPSWPIRSAGTDLLNSMWLFSLVSPFIIVSVITVERYKTIKSFTLAGNGMSTRTLLLLILGIWFYSVTAVGFMAGNFEPASDNYYQWNINKNFYYPFLALHIVIPLCLVCVVYYKIFQISKTPRASSERFDDSFDVTVHKQRREIRLAKTLGIVIGLLFLLWLPVLVIECFYATESTSCITEAAGPVSVWLTASNGVMNPVIYFYRNPNLRGALKKALNFRKDRTKSQLTTTLLYNKLET